MSLRPIMLLSLALLLLLQHAIPTAYACGTCGCSEVCPIAMIENDAGNRRDQSAYSDSIIGNMLLKLAYQRDEKLRSLQAKRKFSGSASDSMIAVVAGGALAQNNVSLVALNPAPGHEDSYVPGAIGIGFTGLAMSTVAARSLVNSVCNKKAHSRQLEIKQQVEKVLNHLEFSKMTCPEAQKELLALVGERAAQDFTELWKSSHDVGLATVNVPISAPGMIGSVVGKKISPERELDSTRAVQ